MLCGERQKKRFTCLKHFVVGLGLCLPKESSATNRIRDHFVLCFGAWLFVICLLFQLFVDWLIKQKGETL